MLIMAVHVTTELLKLNGMAFLKFISFRCEHELYFVNRLLDNQDIVLNFRVSDSGCRCEGDYRVYRNASNRIFRQ